ncbi:hypothetical protein GPALN_012309, partial [Globodera pallida]
NIRVVDVPFAEIFTAKGDSGTFKFRNCNSFITKRCPHCTAARCPSTAAPSASSTRRMMISEPELEMIARILREAF